jgi:hypothetical protein
LALLPVTGMTPEEEFFPTLAMKWTRAKVSTSRSVNSISTRIRSNAAIFVNSPVLDQEGSSEWGQLAEGINPRVAERWAVNQAESGLSARSSSQLEASSSLSSHSSIRSVWPIDSMEATMV